MYLHLIIIEFRLGAYCYSMIVILLYWILLLLCGEFSNLKVFKVDI